MGRTFPISDSDSVQATTTANMSRSVIFRNDPSQQEAVAVPLDTGKASSYTLVQDNSESVDGLALANPAWSQP
jgi:hypothetical protein